MIARAALVALILAPLPALAAAPMLRLESVDPRRCADDTVVRLSFVELELDGQLRAFPPAEYRLMVDGRALAGAPIGPRTFADTDEPLAVAVVIQANLAWQRDLPAILGSVEAFFERLPPRAKVWLWTYGDGVDPLVSAALPGRAAEKLGSVRPSDTARAAARPAIRQALDAVADLSGRRVVVVLSDGIDDTPSREEVRALGNLARARRVSIMPIAYSPKDERGPFLDLAELAKRSSGLFRWAEDAPDVGRELVGLSDALSKSWVMDFEMPEPCERSHEVQVMRGELRSDPQAILAQVASGGGPPAWLGAVVALLVVGSGAALFTLRRKR